VKILFRKSSDIWGLLNIVFRVHTGYCFCSIRRQEVMTMRRLLISFTLIAFVIVGCAGPNKVGSTKPNFLQEQFEKDRIECSDSIDKNLNSEAFGKALEECLAKKGYGYKKAEEAAPSGNKTEEPPSGKKVTAKDIGLTALLIVLSPLILAYGVWLIGQPL
jgi:hypothetical protein